jgi:hypothetical protein
VSHGPKLTQPDGRWQSPFSAARIGRKLAPNPGPFGKGEIMRRPLLFALLVGSLLASPALADVTVRYRAIMPAGAPGATRANPPTMTISADGNGQARWEMAAPGTPAEGARQPSVALIAREGVGYFALNGPQAGMQIVGRIDDAFALGAQFAQPILQGPAHAIVTQVMNQHVEIMPVGPETVSGIQGNLYRVILVTGETRSPPLEIVVATDPRLAPIGREFVRMIESVRPTVVAVAGSEPQLYAALRGMAGLGAPLRIGNELRVDSVSTDDVPDSQFALPGPVMSREQLQTMMGAMMGAMGQGHGSGQPAPGAHPPAPATPPGNAANPH